MIDERPFRPAPDLIDTHKSSNGRARLRLIDAALFPRAVVFPVHHCGGFVRERQVVCRGIWGFALIFFCRRKLRVG